MDKEFLIQGKLMLLGDIHINEEAEKKRTKRLKTALGAFLRQEKIEMFVGVGDWDFKIEFASDDSHPMVVGLTDKSSSSRFGEKVKLAKNIFLTHDDLSGIVEEELKERRPGIDNLTIPWIVIYGHTHEQLVIIVKEKTDLAFDVPYDLASVHFHNKTFGANFETFRELGNPLTLNPGGLYFINPGEFSAGEFAVLEVKNEEYLITLGNLFTQKRRRK